MLELDLYNKTKTRILRKVFENILPPAQRALMREKIIHSAKNFLIELTLVGNKKITALNALYHKKNHPTDVISLSFFEEHGTDPFVGEIFICLPYARAQARQIGQSLQEELRFLFVHGLLHLFGYDHVKPKEEARMKKLAYKILGREK